MRRCPKRKLPVLCASSSEKIHLYPHAKKWPEYSRFRVHEYCSETKVARVYFNNSTIVIHSLHGYPKLAWENAGETLQRFTMVALHLDEDLLCRSGSIAH